MKSVLLYLAILISVAGFAQSKKGSPNKEAVIKSVESHQQELVKISDAIWGYAETALREHKSSKELADYADLK
jgi:aminobenzoyl-glutamate utilization protein B